MINNADGNILSRAEHETKFKRFTLNTNIAVLNLQ